MLNTARLKELRGSRGLSKKEIADAIDITERAYVTYEYGERNMPIEVLCKLADFYNVSTDYLLGRDSNVTDAVGDFCNENNIGGFARAVLYAYTSLLPSTRKEFETVLEVLARAGVDSGVSAVNTYNKAVAQAFKKTS